MRDCINGVDPIISINNICPSYVRIAYYEYYDSNQERYYYAGSVTVEFAALFYQGEVISTEDLGNGLRLVVYEYKIDYKYPSNLFINNRDNGSKLIASITIG